MPQIIVIADRPADEAPVMFRERVTATDFESDYFARQLAQRVGWAVGDAEEVERADAAAPPQAHRGTRAPARQHRSGRSSVRLLH